MILTAAASIWTVNIPILLGENAAQGASRVSSICMLVTSGFGIATLITYWLTFFPPA